jgi:Mg-chelatase subunit ChlD
MICERVYGIELLASFRLSCTSGLAHDLTVLIVAATVLSILAWALREALLGHRGKAARAAMPMIAAALFLAIGSAQPVLISVAVPEGGTVVAVVDISQSTVRDPDAFRRMVFTAGSMVDELSERLSTQSGRAAWQAAIVRFSDGAEMYSEASSLAALGEALRQMPVPPATGLSSAAGAGLRRAHERIRENGSAGMILLVGDGNWSRPALDDEVLALQQAGIPVYAVPGGSSAPGSGIVAAGISTVTETGAPSILRLVVRANQAIGLSLRNDLDGDVTPIGVLGEEQGTVPLRIEQHFDRRGLRFIEAILSAGDTDGEMVQARRLFTLVKAPPRGLVFGAAPWVDALPKERITLERGDPLTPRDDLSAFDVIVIDALAPNAFPQEFPRVLAETAAGRGQGVLIANGTHTAGPASPTTIERWEETEIGSLLPVSADMRQYVVEPPPRDLVMIFDTSGSMGGGELSLAKAMAISSLDQLRPIDRLSIVNFSGRPLFMDQAFLTAANRRQAEDIINNFVASGGSDAASALNAVAEPSANSCAVFFFTDGAISGVTRRPGCVTTVIGFGSGASGNASLVRLGEVIRVDIGDDPMSIRTAYLEPEIRDERWRAQVFEPLLRAKNLPMLAPELPVPGLAITYPRPEALVVSVHPESPPDPVLAFREDLRGIVGVFTGDLSRAWGGSDRGHMAILGVLERLSGWREIDRYGFSVRESASGLLLSVSVFDQEDHAIPSRIEARVVVDGQPVVPVDLRPVPGQRGRFEASAPIPYATARDRRALTGMLFLSEVGQGSLQVQQRIPVRLPTRGADAAGAASGETWHFGVDRVSLSWLTRATGGQVLDVETGIRNRDDRAGASVTKIYHWMLALSLVCFSLGLIWGRARQ